MRRATAAHGAYEIRGGHVKEDCQRQRGADPLVEPVGAAGFETDANHRRWASSARMLRRRTFLICARHFNYSPFIGKG